MEEEDTHIHDRISITGGTSDVDESYVNVNPATRENCEDPMTSPPIPNPMYNQLENNIEVSSNSAYGMSLGVKQALSESITVTRH